MHFCNSCFFSFIMISYHYYVILFFILLFIFNFLNVVSMQAMGDRSIQNVLLDCRRIYIVERPCYRVWCFIGSIRWAQWYGCILFSIIWIYNHNVPVLLCSPVTVITLCGLNIFYSKEKDWVWHKTGQNPLQKWMCYGRIRISVLLS